uniref:Disease resistance N-terminal domain-containing protein n=1 Tax=Leersia perrieri TaxID=77586 RepID=A0A0D9XHK5_9ORYZ
MEAAISAIVSDQINRLMSFLMKKYTEYTSLDDKMKRLKELLLRLHIVVEEADGRCITNPRMLMQLKMLSDSMYRGYYMLDTIKYISPNDEVRRSSTMSVSLKRSRTILGIPRSPVIDNELQTVLNNLEAVLSNMNEFVLLLMGCERMCRRPYDAYLYVDNFMFGRHAERQQIVNILMQKPGPHDDPLVLPIIGGCRVGKKALVSHACNNERVRSYFSSILYINGDSRQGIDHAKFKIGRTLIVAEFFMDVDEDDWVKFYSTISQMTASGSKIIIISRAEKLARFGTVKAVHLNSLSQEEYSYLFKMLAFGSIDEKDHPKMASVANDLAVVLGGSLITANVISDLLRRNPNIHFWLHILRRFEGMVKNNLSKYGEHPKDILEKEKPIDITRFLSSYPTCLQLMPPRVEKDHIPNRKKPRMSFGDLVIGCSAIPDGDFELVTWQSRIPPYTKYVQSVAVFVDGKNGCTTSTRKRRSSS